jgi:Tol biopolymer transport system component
VTTTRGALLLVAALATALGCLEADRLIAVGRDGGASAGWVPFGAPALVGGLRGDNDDVQDPTLTGDELELAFASPTGGVNDIWSSRRSSATAAWEASGLVTELASTGNDEDPDLSEDGLTIHFSSDRAGNGMRLYVSRRTARDQPWMAPQPEGDVGPSLLDRAPSVDAAQVHMVFASQRGTATVLHLFSATRADQAAAWQNVVELTAINSAWQDVDPALFAAGRGLIFISRRTGQGRTADLYRTARADAGAPFDVTPVSIDELNTADSSEGDPWLSEDGRHILFASDRSGRNRIYEARR